MTKQKMYCCERCQIYWTCERKWYRGERNEEDLCCDDCNFYRECLAEFKKKKQEK